MEDLLQNLSAVKSSSCYAAGLCTSIIGIDPSGAVSPCTRPFHSRYVFGNIGEMTLEELEQTQAYQQFVADEQHGQALTHQCEWADLCGYGNCPHERFSAGVQDPAGRHFFCSCRDVDASNSGYPGFYKRFHGLLQGYLQNHASLV
jgi:radical SAM protein with 4Fe4S-binding SPASM domain